MKNFSTNWYLYNTLNSKDKSREVTIAVVQSEEIENKIKKIKKAFK